MSFLKSMHNCQIHFIQIDSMVLAWVIIYINMFTNSLGLPIVKDSLLRMKTDISVESQVGQGN